MSFIRRLFWIVLIWCMRSSATVMKLESRMTGKLTLLCVRRNHRGGRQSKTAPALLVICLLPLQDLHQSVNYLTRQVFLISNCALSTTNCCFVEACLYKQNNNYILKWRRNLKRCNLSVNNEAMKPKFEVLLFKFREQEDYFIIYTLQPLQDIWKSQWQVCLAYFSQVGLIFF